MRDIFKKKKAENIPAEGTTTRGRWRERVEAKTHFSSSVNTDRQSNSTRRRH